MKSVLIFGSEGFIGKSLVNEFLAGWAVSGIDRFDTVSGNYQYFKLLSTSDLTELLLKNKYDFIINAAGSGNVGFSVEHPLSDFESNSFETAKILDAIRIASPSSKYLHISSAAVYGNPDRLPVKETDSLNPLSPYGWHKLMSEILCREYHEIYGLNTCIIRPFSVYGPGLKKQLFWDVYCKAVENDTVELFGTGNETRDFIYITELAKAFVVLLNQSSMKGEVYNIASGNEVEIRSVVELFVSHFKCKKKIVFNGKSKVGDPLKWQANIDKIYSLGFRPSVKLEDGIINTFKWIESAWGKF